MANSIGTVKALTGTVIAVAADGSRRELRVGDKVYENEIISTTEGGAIALQLADGSLMDIGRNSRITLSEEGLGRDVHPAPAETPAQPAPSQPVMTAEEIQKMILAGADPTKIADATAAGPAAPAAGTAAGTAAGEGGGGHSFVLVDYTGPSVTPDSGYDTGSVPVVFGEAEGQFLLQGTGTQPQVSVTLDGGADPSLVVSGDAVNVVEGSGGGTQDLTFTLSLNQVSSVDVTVTYQLRVVSANGAADNPDDWFDGIGGPITVTIPAGQTVLSIHVHIVKDNLVESDGRFEIVLLSATNATLNPAASSFVVTIVNDDHGPEPVNDTNWAAEDRGLHFDAGGNVLEDHSHDRDDGMFADVMDTDVDGDSLAVNQIQSQGGAVTLSVGPGTTFDTGTVIEGSFGRLFIGSDGNYRYLVDDLNPEVNALDDGDTTTDVFTYTVSDGFNTQTATLTITIYGTNDGPVAWNDVNSVTEDAQLTATGNVIAGTVATGSGGFGGPDIDADGDDLDITLISSASGNLPSSTDGDATFTIVGLYGTLVINKETGDYTYTLDNGNSMVNGLDDGDPPLTDEVFTYTVGDGDLSATATLTIIINGANDAPLAENDTNWGKEGSFGSPAVDASGNVLQTLAHDGAPSGSFGDVADADVDLETLTVNSVNGSAANVGVALAGLYGTLTLNGDGSYSYIVDNANPEVNGLDDGETRVDSFSYTVTDGSGVSNPAALEITVFGTNDAPQVKCTQNWMSSDPGQQSPGFEDGYRLLVGVPTDVDGDNLVVTATGSVPTGVYYYDGTGYVALTAGTVLYDPSLGINFLDDLVYRPTANPNDVVNKILSLDVFDGDVHVTEIVGIHEAVPTRIPGPSGEISSGNAPLTSGHNADADVVLGDEFAAALNIDPADGNLVLRTNFQDWPSKGPKDPTDTYYTVNAGDRNGDLLEQQVNVYLYVDGIKFQVIDAGDANPNNWIYDPVSGLMKAVVDFENIVNTSDPGQTLAEYLALPGNSTSGTDTWVIEYDDTTPGNDQARYFDFQLNVFDPDDPGITVGGSDCSDQIYGTSGTDVLSGGKAVDILVGRAGDDILSGGDGNDILLGGAGDDQLMGDAGADTLVGGRGADIFVLKSDGTVVDRVTDYDYGDGDVLNLSDLLPDGLDFVGDNPNPDADINDYVRLLNDGGTTNQVQVDVDGALNGVSFTTVATVQSAVTQVQVMVDDQSMTVTQTP